MCRTEGRRQRTELTCVGSTPLADDARLLTLELPQLRPLLGRGQLLQLQLTENVSSGQVGSGLRAWQAGAEKAKTGQMGGGYTMVRCRNKRRRSSIWDILSF